MTALPCRFDSQCSRCVAGRFDNGEVPSLGSVVPRLRTIRNYGGA